MSREKSYKDSSAESPANLSRKRPASERRIEANRRNAAHSTGPTTEQGKRTVARNAIKHGILAREVVITDGDGEESLKEFHDLVKQLYQCYEPIGIVEESLVQTIATCWWRKARVIRAENGEIRKRLDTLEKDRARRNSDEGNHEVASWDLSGRQGEHHDLKRHHAGLEYLTNLLNRVKSEITSDGYISENNRDEICQAFCFWDYSFAMFCYCCGSQKELEDRPSERVVDEKDVNEKRDVTHELIACLIDGRLNRISKLKEDVTERENLALDAEARHFSLPPADATDKILRYEAHLDKQLYRAMDQLERLQRQRRGENVPPPLNINLGRRR
jgi:hypothetical protein